jgi:hypothetical protein
MAFRIPNTVCQKVAVSNIKVLLLGFSMEMIPNERYKALTTRMGLNAVPERLAYCESPPST